MYACYRICFSSKYRVMQNRNAVIHKKCNPPYLKSCLFYISLLNYFYHKNLLLAFMVI